VVTPEEIFVGSSEMATLLRSLDWSQTSLGSIATWSQSLRTSISICLSSRFPILLWWGTDLVMFYNDAYRPILGSKHPKSMGQQGRDCWVEVWDVIGPMLEGVLMTGEATWSENQILLLDRHGYIEECYFTFSYSPIADETGSTGGVFTAVTETTRQVIGERRLQTLRDLAANTAKAKTVEEAYEAAIAALTGNTNCIPFALLYRIESDDQAHLVGITGLEAGTAASPRVVGLSQVQAWPFEQVQAIGKPQRIENLGTRFGELFDKNGVTIANDAIMLPLTQAGDKHRVIGFLVLGISPKLAFNLDYQSFFALVAGSVETAIANVEAYEAERRRAEALAELDRAKTTFFSNVSHEFRTPLALMLDPLDETLNRLNGQLPAAEQEQLQMVQRNGQRLLKLVNTLLDFSRIEAGRMAAVYEPTDLAAFTAELASVFRSAIAQANLSLVVDCPPLAKPAWVDREMWEKIVLNLLSNAFKFTLEGAIVIVLREHNDQIELEVRDTGIGIPADELPHIFERFYRVREAKGRTYEGTGIGLSLVQELVQLHGGTIVVSSIVDQGTSFTVSIPAGYAHLPQDHLGTTRTLTSTAMGVTPYVQEFLHWLPEEGIGETPFSSPTPHSPLPTPPAARILLVDDNSDMRDYVRRLLSDQGYAVETAIDGKAALAAVEQQQPDLVLSDVMMPQLDGFGLLRELRANPNTWEIPIILLSARAGEEARIEGLEAGADDYLTKPFSARELLARVEANLKLSQLRREAEASLRESEEKYRTLFESIDEGFCIVEMIFDAQEKPVDYRFLQVNPAFVRLSGLSKATMGKTVRELLPNLEEFWFEVYGKVALTGKAVRFEQQSESLDNRWFDVYASRIGDAASRYVAIVFNDITQRKQAEQEREHLLAREQSANQTLQRFIESTPTAVVMLDQEMRYLFASRRWMQEYAPTYSDLRGLSHYEVMGDVPQHWREVHQRCLAGATERCEEDYYVRADGSGHWLYWEILPWYASERDVGGIILFAENITERKQANQEREHLLERERAAREAAETANRVKDEFLAVLSHELRSPLNPILGWSTLLLNNKLDEAKTAQALTTIQRNAKLQSELIEDLLDVSRILQGKLSLNVASVNLASTIRAAMETVRLAAEAKSITVEASLSPDVGLVSGDATRLQQVIWNLLSNAVKFTQKGGQITIHLERLDSYAHITVSDTGQGIAPDFLPYVFDYFRQANAATTRKFGGLGLGLAIVRHLVELHGGTVEVESPGVGQGATFTVRLPLMPIQLASNQHNQPSKLSPDLKGIQVLVVDDEPDSREFVAFVLEQAGAKVITATTADEALTMLIRSQPNILLSDIGMPDVDGYMLMQRVRALQPEQGGQVKAIALTAYAGEMNQQQALQAGFQRHISKPVEPEVLVGAIASLLNRP
jgi:PAS domain S-box-containing protein